MTLGCPSPCGVQVRGYGLSGDAHHITQPPPDGIGAQLAMRGALRQAGLRPRDICYINAHATSTPQGERGLGWVWGCGAAWPAAGEQPHLGAGWLGGRPWPAMHAWIVWTGCAAVGGPCFEGTHCLRRPPAAASAGDDIEQRAIAAVFGEAATSASPPGGGPPLAVSSTKGATGHLLGAAGAVEAIFSLLALRHGVAPATANLADPDPPLLANLVAGQPCALAPGPRAVLSNSFGFGGTNAALVFCTAPGREG